MSSLSSETTTSTPLSKKPSHNACLSCRASRVKCKSSSIHQPCERCRKNALNCVFEPHRRGRKPGARIKRLQSYLSEHASLRMNESTAPQSVIAQLPSSDRSILSPISRDANAAEIPPENGGFGSVGLQPVSILSKEAQSGKFSLENILCVPDVLEPNQASKLVLGRGSAASTQDDPVSYHILTFPVALGLFESFMRCLNPYISQLDPKLHTFEYVRQRSPFLLTAILSTSSKAFHPSLHPTLRAHSEKLLGEAFVKGTKSAETIQAVLIFTYWKEPDELRTWLLVGYTIRMAIELGWHDLELSASDGGMGGNEISMREERNIERTWLVLFFYDRSLSLQLGKPWMIEQKGIISKADTWYRNEFAVPGGDLLLAAFVDLRIVSTEMLQLVSPTGSTFDGPHGEMLSKTLNNSITMWEQKWLPLFEIGTIAPCHLFLAKFYGLHLRLLLNSYSLQASLSNANNSASISKSVLWHCSSSAIGMLEKISTEFGPYKQLYFAQDSIHVMVAYAAIFLIKLLVALPKSLRSDFEPHSVQAILKATETFEQQCATQMTACAMQARFLKSVIKKYESLKSQTAPTGHSDQASTSQKAHHAARRVLNSHPSDPVNYEKSDQSDIQFGRADSGSQQYPTSQTVLGTNLFADKDLWDSLFSDVGFWMNDGFFLSETSNFI